MGQSPDINDLEQSSNYFSEDKFWNKLDSFATEAGIRIIYVALILFYGIFYSSKKISTKTIIIGALGYFIIPFDIIPDLLPIIGFSDDLAAFGLALTALMNDGGITESVKQQANKKLSNWFDDIDESKLSEYLNL